MLITNQDYMDNTYKFEEIFNNLTILDFRKAHNMSVSTVATVLFGRCYTICPMEKIEPFVKKYINLSDSTNIEVFFHSAGDEFWLTYDNPTEVSSVILRVVDNHGMKFASVTFKEIRTNILDKANSPCRNYETHVHDEGSFIDCSKNVLRQRVTPALRCTLNGMEELIEKPSELPGD
jgi:hypothetical protein